MTKGRWSSRAIPGAIFELRVTPGARRDSLTDDGLKGGGPNGGGLKGGGPNGEGPSGEGGPLRCTTTAAPEDGRANAAVAEQLARALGVAKTRLTLLRGATSRDKVFRLD